MAQHTGLDITVFSLDGENLIGILTECEFQPNNKVEEGKAINDVWDDPVIVGKGGRYTGTAHVDDQVRFTAEVITGGYVVCVYNTGAGTFNFSAVLTEASHRGARDSLQTENFTLLTKGTVTFTPSS